MRRVLVLLLCLCTSLVWLTLLVASGFSGVAVAAGLMAVLYVTGRSA
ncbi:MAG TPA: hypothetical protein VF221_07515 [Chloroflexota bacterium]